ncbi:MAG TPA: hypothetical protein VG476_02495 [Acidimicrobiales bacterium]|nr:hypothetical protein [Acidimicrobiales bacterium]
MGSSMPDYLTRERTCVDCGARYTVAELPVDTDHTVTDDRCHDCNALVYGWGPCNGDGPFFMASTIADLRAKDGDTFGGCQCESCGACQFVYHHIPRTVRCTACSAPYLVHVHRSYAVVWP